MVVYATFHLIGLTVGYIKHQILRFGVMTIEIGVTFDNQILLEPHLTLELHLTSNIIGITFDTQILRSHI